MVRKNGQEGASRVSLAETFFDRRETYDLKDWLFRVNLYYEMLLCMTGPNGMNANEAEMEIMLSTLNMIHWGEDLPPDCLIGYETDDGGEIHPYAIVPKPKYLL